MPFRFSCRRLFRRSAIATCGRQQMPSILLCLAALLSILPIILASSKSTSSKDISPSFLLPSNTNWRWTTFLRGGGIETAATSRDDKDPTSHNSGLSTAEYRTIQVQIIHRHGDRTPITPLKDESYWASTLVPPEMLEKVSKGTNVLHHESTGNQHVAQGRGPFGKLTKMGLLQMIDVGSQLKEQLEQGTRWSPKARISFQPFQLSPRDIKIYSTDFARTIQSVQGLLVGFFPDGPSEPIDIDCRHTTSWMIPDPQPRRSKEQESLELELATRPHVLEREAEMRPLAIRCTQSLLPLLGDDAFKVSYGVGEETNNGSNSIRTLSWAQLSEMTKCLQVRNLLPESITVEDQEATSAYCAWKWFESLRNPRLAYLSMHHFTHTIVQGMKEFENEPPLIIFSCHDSSLIGLLCAFHLEQPSAWPEYGSVLKIELLEKTGHKDDDLVVRFYLNGELLRSMWHGRSRDEISLRKLAHYISTVGAVKAS
ncbi:histidine phosphatase superfamily branch 2 protein [Nitzschia inconspicua]|uniref:Histidine phosphatase superfamily branch 2 protein n=1 Tax=Nitzschia inconspicua TaxID=303405 RepID=A0A9K3PJP4_9STRA|nr:histidine phosphatase superfamily branch 2 protein [Nitzschia inconspicua]